MSFSLELNLVSNNVDIAAITDQKVKSVVIGMVRNESDIISSWVSHALAVFDRLLLVDHMSTDGTFEFLLELSSLYPEKVFLYRFEHPGYYQEEICNRLAEIASLAFPSAWIMPMDSDEFLMIPENKCFSELVEHVDENNALLFSWKTIIPYNVAIDSEFTLHSPAFFSQTPSFHSKCGIHARLLHKHGLRFMQGNHRVNNKVEYVAVGDMLHVPLRSIDHLMFKCVQGCIAYESIDISRSKEGQGFHWFQMMKLAVDAGGINEDQLRDIASHYGQPDHKSLGRLSIYDLTERGWNINSLLIAHENHNIKLVRKKTYKGLTRDIEHRIQDPQVRNMISNYNLLNNKVSPCYNNSIVKTLISNNSDNNSEKAEYLSEIDFLTQFIAPSFKDIEHVVPSAWSEHIPFMFCLMNYLRPRRYVELGTHFGGSLFAACQISKESGNSIDCIGIDTWKGDEHAGIYGEEVFNKFYYILNKAYSDCGGYIRKDFNAAASNFESGSIDILHIDGLHTYDAVKNDYEVWRSKLSSSGIIMFHDTHVVERNFGVHILWNELRKLYPSFEFEHGHGLGLIYVGSNQSSPASAFFKRIQSEALGNFLRQFFLLQGKSIILSGERQMRINSINAMGDTNTKVKIYLTKVPRLIKLHYLRRAFFNLRHHGFKITLSKIREKVGL